MGRKCRELAGWLGPNQTTRARFVVATSIRHFRARRYSTCDSGICAEQQPENYPGRRRCATRDILRT